MFCRSCGQELKTGAEICPNCNCKTMSDINTNVQAKLNLGCLFGFVCAFIGLILVVLCYALHVTISDLYLTGLVSAIRRLGFILNSLITCSITSIVVGSLLSIWGTNTAQKNEERLGFLGIAGIFISAISILIAVIMSCFAI